MDIQDSVALQVYDALTNKNRELRKANVKLMEEKRELLLQLQQSSHAHGHANRHSDACDEFKKKSEMFGIEKISTNQDALLQESPPRVSNELNKKQENTWGINQFEDIVCCCESMAKLRESVKANHQWNDAYKQLVDRYHDSERKIHRLEQDLDCKNEENNNLNKLLQTLESDLEKSEANNHRNSTDADLFSNGEIEALRMQLQTYQEDFNCEKRERQKSEKNAKMLQKQLTDSNATIRSLSQEVSQYKSYLLRMSEEKKHVLLELRRLSDSSYFAPSPQFHVPVRRNGSYPLNTIDDVTSWPTLAAAQLRRSDSDLYRNADVVRDNEIEILSR